MTSTEAQIKQAISQYRPKGFEGTPREAARLAFIAARVGESGWPTVEKARKAMGHSWGFSAWLETTGRPLDGSAWQREVIDAYVASLADRKQGTRDAIRSYLSRMAIPSAASPGRATAPAPPRTRVVAEPAMTGSSHGLSSSVTRALGREELSESARAFMVTTLETAGVKGRVVKPRVLPALLPLVRLVEDQHRPLRTDVVFATATIEECLTTLDKIAAAKSVATYASELYQLQAVLVPVSQRGAGVRVGRGEKHPARIDSDEITDRLLQWANTRRSEAARRHNLALIALVRGAGASGIRAARTKTTDVHVHPDRSVTVTLTEANGDQRPVSVRAKWAPLLARCVEGSREAGDEWLVGGSSNRKKRADRMTDQAKRAGAPLDLLRMRNTWMVEVCQQYDLVGLIETLGLASPSSLERLWPVLKREPRR